MNDIQNLTVKLQITVKFMGISMKMYRTDSWRIKNQLDVTCYIYFTS